MAWLAHRRADASLSAGIMMIEFAGSLEIPLMELEMVEATPSANLWIDPDSALRRAQELQVLMLMVNPMERKPKPMLTESETEMETEMVLQ